MAVVLVLLATIANAMALVLQRKAAQDSARSRGISAGTLRDMVQRPAWLVGTSIFCVAVGLQAVALSLGSIALVQPVLVMELPFTLLLGWFVLGGALRRREWIAVAIMSVGLVVLLVSLQPSGGDALGAGTVTLDPRHDRDPRPARRGQRDRRAVASRGPRRVVRHRRRHRLGLRGGDRQGDVRGARGAAGSAGC